MSKYLVFFFCVVCVLSTGTIRAQQAGMNAQQGAVLGTQDYQHAENFLAYNTDALVDHGSVSPNWLSGDRFWYRILTAQGSEFILVDPAKGSRTEAFDQQKLAAALSTANGKMVDPYHLPFRSFRYSADGRSMLFRSDAKRWKYDLQSNQLSSDTTKTGDREGDIEPGSGRRRGNRGNEVVSPDGMRAAFIKDYNLWVRDLATGRQIQLTIDGVKDFGYATDNAGWVTSDRAILQWSPDSRKIAVGCSNRISGISATCIWLAPMSANPFSSHGNIRCQAIKRSSRSSG